MSPSTLTISSSSTTSTTSPSSTSSSSSGDALSPPTAASAPLAASNCNQFDRHLFHHVTKSLTCETITHHESRCRTTIARVTGADRARRRQGSRRDGVWSHVVSLLCRRCLLLVECAALFALSCTLRLSFSLCVLDDLLQRLPPYHDRRVTSTARLRDAEKPRRYWRAWVRIAKLFFGRIILVII